MQAFGSSDVFRWNAPGAYFTRVTQAEPVKPGEGYFIYTRNSTLPELASYDDVPGIEYAYPLKFGMNLISNPFSGNMKLADVKIQKGRQAPVSWQEAAIRGWIHDHLYFYQGEDWGDSYFYDTAEGGANLVPWLGYWISLNVADDTYTLIIPRP